MKKNLSLIVVLLLAFQAWAQTTEYLQQKEFQLEKKKIYEGINASKKQLTDLKKADTKIVQLADSIKRAAEINAGQLVLINDSLTRTSEKLNLLKEQFEGQKLLSRSLLILFFVIILILFLIVFILLFMFKRKADVNHQSIIDLDKKINDRFDQEIKMLNDELKSHKDSLAVLSSELSQMISNGLNAFDVKFRQMETQSNEDMLKIDRKCNSLGPEIDKMKAEQSQTAKNLEDKLHAYKRDADFNNQALASRTSKIEEELKSAKEK